MKVRVPLKERRKEKEAFVKGGQGSWKDGGGLKGDLILGKFPGRRGKYCTDTKKDLWFSLVIWKLTHSGVIQLALRKLFHRIIIDQVAYIKVKMKLC